MSQNPLTAAQAARTILSSYDVLAATFRLSLSNPEVKKAYRDLQQLDATAPSPTLAFEVLRRPEIARITPALQTLCQTASENGERDWASHLARCDSKRLSRLMEKQWYMRNASTSAETEIAQLKQASVLPSKGRLALVGGSWMPVSALALAKASGLDVTVFAENAQQGQSVQQLMLKTSNRVTTLFMKASQAQYRNISVVLIGRSLPDKADVIERVRETSPNATIAVRTPGGFAQLLSPSPDIVGLNCSDFDLKQCGAGGTRLTLFKPQQRILQAI